VPYRLREAPEKERGQRNGVKKIPQPRKGSEKLWIRGRSRQRHLAQKKAKELLESGKALNRDHSRITKKRECAVRDHVTRGWERERGGKKQGTSSERLHGGYGNRREDEESPARDPKSPPSDRKKGKKKELHEGNLLKKKKKKRGGERREIPLGPHPSRFAETYD